MRLVAVTIIALWIGGCATPITEPHADFWLRDVHVVDTETGAVLRHHAIGIRGEDIVAIVPDREVRVTRTAQIVPGNEAYAIPGLWDSHVHLLQDDTDAAMRAAARILSYGTTHVRDMGSSLSGRAAFLARAATARSDAPTVLSSGPTFWAFALPYGDANQKMQVEDPAGVDAAVDRLADAGVDFLKVYAGFNTSRLAQLMGAAQRRQLRVAGHAQPGTSLAEQARLGLLSVEHLDFATLADCHSRSDAFFERVIAARFRGSGESIPEIYSAFAAAVDNDACRAALREAAAAGLALTPTLITAFLPASQAEDIVSRLPKAQAEGCELYVRDFSDLTTEQRAVLTAAGQRLMRVVLDAGIPILAGTDTPAMCAIPGESLAIELRLMAEAGLPLLATLQSATLLPAKLFGRQPRLGKLAVGSEASIVLLSANPLETVEAYSSPIGLFVHGRWRDAAALQGLRPSLR